MASWRAVLVAPTALLAAPGAMLTMKSPSGGFVQLQKHPNPATVPVESTTGIWM